MLSLSKLKKWASKAEDYQPGPEPSTIEKAIRVQNGDDGFVLSMGKQLLCAYPERSAEGGPDVHGMDWILLDPDRYFSSVAAFARLKNGEELLVGRDNYRLDRIFGFPKSVARRHLILANANGRIVIKPQDDEGKTKISATPAGLEGAQIATREKENLSELRDIYGGNIELLETLGAMATLDDVLAILSHEAYRQKNAQGFPGGLLTPPDAPTPIIVGDTHAQIDNLVTVLVQWGVLKGLSRGDVYLLLLGDFVHREGSGELEEMDSSLLALDLLFKLKVAFPERVFFLRGNHENFGNDVGKGGVPQGKLLWSRARELRGKKYARRLAQCFDQLAYVAKTSDYIACHGGPPRQKISASKLINLEEYPKVARDLVWNRLRRTGWPDGYSKRDVKLFREGLGAEKETPFIVSHTPLSRDDSVWLDAGGIAGHHIIFSANPKAPAVMLRGEGGMVPLWLRCYAKSQ